MSTAAALYAKLAADTAVAAIVGTDIFPLTVAQGTAAPYIIFQQIGSDPAVTHGEAAGATHRAFQFACFAATYEGAIALRDAVIAALDTVALSTGESPTLTDERDGDYDDAAELHRADCDFSV